MPDEELFDAISNLVLVLVAADYDLLERDGRAGRLPAIQLEEAVRAYGKTLVPLPPEARANIGMIERTDGSNELAVDVDLWTREEGRSDLTLQLTAKKIGDRYALSIDDLHML